MMGQDISSILCISIGDYTLEVTNSFTCLESVSGRELTIRICKVATGIARLAKRTGNNNLFKIKTKVKMLKDCFFAPFFTAAKHGIFTVFTLEALAECFPTKVHKSKQRYRVAYICIAKTP